MDKIERLRKSFKYILENWNIKSESDIDNIVYLLLKEVKKEYLENE